MVCKSTVYGLILKVTCIIDLNLVKATQFICTQKLQGIKRLGNFVYSVYNFAGEHSQSSAMGLDPTVRLEPLLRTRPVMI